MAEKRKLSITFIAGPIASGKSTLMEAMAKEYFLRGYYVLTIEVSSFIKKLLKSTDRAVLQNSAGLGAQAAEQIIEKIERELQPTEFSPRDVQGKLLPLAVLVSGPRELQVVDMIMEAFKGEGDRVFLWTSATRSTLYSRWLQRKGVKHTPELRADFEAELDRDNALGLTSVRSYFAGY